MRSELFQTEAWFANLLEFGFEAKPSHHWLPLPSTVGNESAGLHLIEGQFGVPLSALSNYYSCLYGPVGEVSGMTADQWLVAALAIQQLRGSAVVRLQPVDAGSKWFSDLEAGLRAAGYWTDRYFCFGNWYQQVSDGGFDSYWAARPPVLRHTAERGRRRLTRAGDWRIDIVCDEQPNLEAAIEAYRTVYAQSWKPPEPCLEFMPELIRTAARNKWLRLGLLWLNGKPLAAQVWLVFGGKANIYKLAFVAGQEKLSVGTVLTAALMRHAIDTDQVDEVDYLTGDEAYKTDWMASRRERVGLAAFDKRRLRGVWAAGLHFMGGGRIFLA